MSWHDHRGHGSPASFPRTIRQALGPHARLDLHTPTPRWRSAVRVIVKGAAYFVAAGLSGAALGFFLAFVERL
jgi:hypothetical protein